MHYLASNPAVDIVCFVSNEVFNNGVSLGNEGDKLVRKLSLKKHNRKEQSIWPLKYSWLDAFLWLLASIALLQNGVVFCLTVL